MRSQGCTCYRFPGATALLLFALVFSLAQGSAPAQGLLTNAPDWTFAAEFQLRSDRDSRDFASATDAFGFTTLRTRAGIQRSINPNIHFFVQLQDARLLGTAPNSLANTANVDVHQAFLQIDSLFSLPLYVQAGRLTLSYGTERFVGATDWNFVGRSFDGARLALRQGGLTVDAFSTLLRESDPFVGIAVPGIASGAGDMRMSGLWGEYTVEPGHKITAFSLLENDARIDNNGNCLLNRLTAGVNYGGDIGGLHLLFEAAYQTGEQSLEDRLLDIAAYVASLRLAYDFGDIAAFAQLDLLSGAAQNTDGPADEIGTIALPYGTNHKFYGYMDYFIDIPVNTAGRGLNDALLGLVWRPDDGDFSATLHAHHMTANRSAAEQAETYGQELDVILTYGLAAKTKLSLGGSVFVAGDLMERLFDVADPDPSLWAYLMLTAQI